MFNINDIKTFEWEDLDGKTLEMYVAKDLSNGTDYTCKTIYGRDIKTGNLYILNQDLINNQI